MVSIGKISTICGLNVKFIILMITNLKIESNYNIIDQPLPANFILPDIINWLYIITAC